MKKVIFVLILVFVVMMAGSSDLLAQCAMCKATVTDNVESGQGIGQGLNKGILYLMSVPYIIGSFIAFFWYKSSKKDSEKQQFLDKIKSKFAK
ncbi:MAG: hypothetical protein NVV82_17810 [Sporocytophaga sp.]|jgi:hypothetical protein|nr:hypothetical protein [Sporocytophaga sp.]